MSGANSTRLLELRVPARPGELRGVRAAVRKGIEGCGCGEQDTADIVLAVDEACQNIIRHAYHGGSDDGFVLRIDRDGSQLIFSLIDFAPTIDPARVQPRDLDDVRPGGLGTHLIRRVMDEAEFLPPPSGRGNLLRMVKRIG